MHGSPGAMAASSASLLLLLVACSGPGASPSASGAGPSTDPSPDSDSALAVGDVVQVLADLPIRSARSEHGQVLHDLTPGDRAIVTDGPVELSTGRWYLVTHHGYEGWVPEASGQAATLSSVDSTAGIIIWDLVWFSDSSGPPTTMWAERIEETQPVTVWVHDFWGGGAEGSAAKVLARIERDEEVRAALASAEIVGFWLNPAGTATGDALADVCGPGDPTPREPPAVYAASDWAEYAGLLRQVLDEILTLRQGQPTVIRTRDLYVPVLDGWRAAGIDAECTAGFEGISETVRAVAAEYGVPMAGVYDAFNGANHDEDPVDKGYIGEDGVHPSAAGNALEVDLLDALGYAEVSSE